MDQNIGQFQTDLASVQPPANLPGSFVTPSGTFSFALGAGISTVWSDNRGDMFADSFLPASPPGPASPLDLRGTQYNGSYGMVPAAVLSDLAAGRGQFQILSGSDAYTGASVPGAVREPAEPALPGLLIGSPGLWHRRRKCYCVRRPFLHLC